jgi:hypothetical protein
VQTHSRCELSVVCSSAKGCFSVETETVILDCALTFCLVGSEKANCEKGVHRAIYVVEQESLLGLVEYLG